jgi:hypothetical protein
MSTMLTVVGALSSDFASQARIADDDSSLLAPHRQMAATTSAAHIESCDGWPASASVLLGG